VARPLNPGNQPTEQGHRAHACTRAYAPIPTMQPKSRVLGNTCSDWGSLARQTERFDGVFTSNSACDKSCLRGTALATWPAGGRVLPQGGERGGADISHSASCGCWDPPAPLCKGGASPRERPPGQGRPTDSRQSQRGWVPQRELWVLDRPASPRTRGWHLLMKENAPDRDGSHSVSCGCWTVQRPLIRGAGISS
jgi:hypothetical protein